MRNNASSSQKAYYVLITLLTFIVFLLLFIFRTADDNRLTSWQWTFIGVDINRIFLIIVFGIIAAYLFSKSAFPERNPSLFLFFSSFIACVFFWKEPEVIVDVSRYFTQAKHLEIYGIKYFLQEWGRGINAWTDLPLVPFLYGLIFKFLGESRLYIQIFTTFLFSMTVVLTYKIGKILWDEETGFFAGIALLGMPYLFTQVPLMLVDIPTMFLLTLLIFTFIKAMNRGGVWIVISSITVFLAFFSKYSTWLMLSVLAVIFIVYLLKGSNPPFPPVVKGGEGGFVASEFRIRNYIYRTALIILIAGFFIGVVILFKFDVISGQIKFLQEYQKPGLKRWGESFLSSFFYQIHPFITIAALYSIYAAFRKKDLKYLIAGCLVFIVVLLQIKRIRYIMVTFPMFALLASYGLQEIKNKEIRKFIVSCAVMSSLVIAIFTYLPFLQRTSYVNLKNAGMFLNAIDAANIEVLTISSANQVVNQAASVPILDLFTSKRIIYYYEPAFYQSPEEIEKSPLRFTWAYKNPAYYAGGSEDSARAVVIISDDLETNPPDYISQKIKGYHHFRVFKISEDIFQYRTIVTVYY
ncbi:MAG: glycosyltransferase family 39 protein [Thermodesulfovibrionia bacterium]|nr:glycosyltransferase family 39 protein [Thermodesulfovibrionia bacterium]